MQCDGHVGGQVRQDVCDDLGRVTLDASPRVLLRLVDNEVLLPNIPRPLCRRPILHLEDGENNIAEHN